MAPKPMRHEEMVKFGALLLAVMIGLGLCITTIRALFATFDVVSYATDNPWTFWGLELLGKITDVGDLGTALVALGLAVWLRDPAAAGARRLFAGAAFFGMLGVLMGVFGSAVIGDSGFDSTVYRWFNLGTRGIWISQISLLAAGLAAAGKTVLRDSSGTFNVLAIGAVCGMLMPSLIEVGAHLFGDLEQDGLGSGAVFFSYVGVMIGWASLIGMCVSIIRRADPADKTDKTSAEGEEHYFSALRLGLFVLAGGLITRMLLAVLLVVQNATDDSFTDLTRSSLDYLTGNLAVSSLAGLIPLAGAWLLWRAARRADKQGAFGFGTTLTLWTVALLLELASLGYGFYHMLGDDYFNLDDVTVAVTLVGGGASLFGLVGMMTLFGALRKMAHDFEGARWARYAERAGNIPVLLVISAVLGVLAAVALRAIASSFVGIPSGLILMLAALLLGYGLYVAWQILSTLLGMANALVTGRRETLDEAGWDEAGW